MLGLLGPPAQDRHGWGLLRVIDKTRESNNVTSLQLEAADGRSLAAGLPGQFVVLRPRPAPDAPPLPRSYSLSGAPSEERYRISVKRSVGGIAGAYVADGVQFGDIIEMTAPRGGFTLQPDDGPVVLLSAGIGVTPVLAMLHALAAAKSPRQVWWLHGAAQNTRLLKKSAPLSKRCPALTVTSATARPILATGLVPISTLPDGSALRFSPNWVSRAMLISNCGPAAFMADLSAGLVGRGYQATTFTLKSLERGHPDTRRRRNPSEAAPSADRSCQLRTARILRT